MAESIRIQRIGESVCSNDTKSISISSPENETKDDRYGQIKCLLYSTLLHHQQQSLSSPTEKIIRNHRIKISISKVHQQSSSSPILHQLSSSSSPTAKFIILSISKVHHPLHQQSSSFSPSAKFIILSIRKVHHPLHQQSSSSSPSAKFIILSISKVHHHPLRQQSSSSSPSAKYIILSIRKVHHLLHQQS